MATIRGLNVEISADATSFNKSMGEMRSNARASQTELNALQKSLELEFDDAKFAQAQKTAQEAIDQTAENARVLRERLKFLEDSGNADTKAYDKIREELAKTELKGEQLQKQLEKINQIKFDHIASQVSAVGDKISGVGKALTPVSALAGATITGLGALGTKAIKAADDIATLATQYDMSAEALQKFNYVALQTDTSADDLYKAFVKVRSGVADIATGTEKELEKNKQTIAELQEKMRTLEKAGKIDASGYKDAQKKLKELQNETDPIINSLQSLNLDFGSFSGAEEQFYAIIDALASMEDQTQMVAVANDVFGEELANKILPLIYAGTDAVQSYCEEYDELGALTNEQVDSLAKFDNVLNKLKTQIQNVFLQIGSSLLPIMEKSAELVGEKVVPKLQQLAEWFNSLSEGQQEFALKAALIVAALAPVLTMVGKLTSGVGNIIGMIPKLNGALQFLAANPIIAIVAVIAAILVLLYTKCEAFRESINNLVMTLAEALQPVLGIIMELFGTLMELLEPLIQALGETLAVIIDLLVVALQPLFDNLSFLCDLLQPLLKVVLIPLQLALKRLQVPLQIIGKLLGWLGKVAQWVQDIATTVADGIIECINWVLGYVEKGINWIIEKINGFIDDINNALGWLGVNIGHIGNVTLHIKTSAEKKTVGMAHGASAPEMPDEDDDDYGGGLVYDKIGAGGTSGDVYNNDYSTNTKTQHVTVTIQNYAADVDVDNLVREINIKLAEAM